MTMAEFRELSRRKPRKYNNSPTRVGDLKFASKAEAIRYQELLLLQRAGAISGLVLQPRFSLYVNGVHVCDYVGDFEYYEQGKHVIEDKKGFKTRDYRLKKRLMLACHGIEVRET